METTRDDKPPVFSRWSSWYWLVILFMIVQVILYSAITFAFA